MIKYTQTIRRKIADELFECVWPLSGVGAWRVKLLAKWQFLEILLILVFSFEVITVKTRQIIVRVYVRTTKMGGRTQIFYN